MLLVLHETSYLNYEILHELDNSMHPMHQTDPCAFNLEIKKIEREKRVFS